MQKSKPNYSKLARIFAVGLMLAAFGIVPFVSSRAQKKSKEAPPKVTNITSRRIANRDVISLSADGALNGIQTWQDPNGSFHLILPGSGDSQVKGTSGVKVRRVGNSLEIEVQAKRGSNVTVQPRFNRIDLVVDGGVESQRDETDAVAKSTRTSPAKRSEPLLASASRATRASIEPGTSRQLVSKEQSSFGDAVPPVRVEKISTTSNSTVTTNSQPAPGSTTAQNAEVAPTTTTPAVTESAPVAPDPANVEGLGDVSDGLSPWWVTIFLFVGLVGIVLWRRNGKAGWEEVDGNLESQPVGSALDPTEINAIVGDRRETSRRNMGRQGGRRNDDSRSIKIGSSELVEPHEQQLVEQRSSTTSMAPAELYGAYRVDQEVSKLVLGQAHRMDVLASRGADDRRAMEASLLKSLRSSELEDEGRRKARQALEDYGFVARQSAAVLLSQDPCERAAAARMLGEVGSPSSLQFLLEALYDTDAIVRTQAVESIGALKLPSAIGALLDIARRYPDVSTSVLSSALNACSIDSLDFFDSPPVQPALFLSDGGDFSNTEIKELEPVPTFVNLPESTDDETFVDTLALLQSGDVDGRATAAQTLAIYRVQRSVSALKLMAATDAEPAVRAAAVASLGAIDHESVFSTVLVALADEARDVRAAAARAVSRLSFDRADAYARVIEISDEQELNDVAHACISTGMAAQALDRLASEDRRQAYEAFSLLSLLAKADQCQPIFDLIEAHADINTCLIAAQLLGLSGHADIATKLRHLAVREGMPEQLRTALMEVVYKIDQMQPA